MRRCDRPCATRLGPPCRGLNNLPIHVPPGRSRADAGRNYPIHAEADYGIVGGWNVDAQTKRGPGKADLESPSPASQYPRATACRPERVDRLARRVVVLLEPV